MTNWLSPAEMRAWRAYIGTNDDLSGALAADLARHGMDLGDYQVLVYLSEAEGNQMRMCDLAERLQLSPSGLTRRLDGLVKSGAVVRQGSALDRRVMMAVLTDNGRADTRERRAASRRERSTPDLRSPRRRTGRRVGVDLHRHQRRPPRRSCVRRSPHAARRRAMTELPAGFRAHVANIGVKDDTDDLVVIAADRPVPVAALFTKSRFAGPSVTLSRRHVANGLRAGGRRDLEERQRRHRPGRRRRCARGGPHRRRSSRLRRRRRGRHVDRRDRPALSDGADPTGPRGDPRSAAARPTPTARRPG